MTLSYLLILGNLKINLFLKTFNDFFGTGALAPVPMRRKKVYFCGKHFKHVSSIFKKKYIVPTRDRTGDLSIVRPTLCQLGYSNLAVGLL